MIRAEAPRVAFVNLGCRVNRVEVDLFANRLEQAGCVVADEADADVVIVNTCAVTGEAQTKTRKALRRAARLPRRPVVVATGCVAALFADELEAIDPAVLVEPNKAQVVERALGALGLQAAPGSGESQLAVAPTPTGRMRPGIKIQDGCDNRCTFCIVWKARGPSRSLPASQVLRAVREACARNAHEVVLTGINLGSYRAPEGDVLAPGLGLTELLEYLLEHTAVERIRLSSLEPPDVTETLLRTMASSDGRVAPFLHVCLQSGCDATLRRMGRVYDTAEFRGLVERARSWMPHVALGTDLIVGFPGETDAEFEESLSFCREMAFARMHVFRYSRRPGTPAATAPDQVHPEVSAARGVRVRALAREMRRSHMRSCVGTADDVLVQSQGHAVSSHLHDVIVDARLEVGELAPVRFVAVEHDRLVGRST